MISEDKIKQIASSYNAYLKGSDLYIFGKVRKISVLKKGSLTICKFKVENKNVSFSLNELEEITSIKCPCFQNDICKEVVACLLFLVNEKEDKRKRLEELLKNKKNSISQ